MDIKKALLNEIGIRVSNSNDRWLVIDEMYVFGGEFVVYERLPYARRTKTVYRGTDEEEAVKALINKRDDENE